MGVQTQERRDFTLTPLADCDPAIGRALAALEESRRRTLKLIAGLSVSALDRTPAVTDAIDNSIGTLLYHIAAIELDWLQTEVLEGKPLPDALWALFPHEVRDAAGRLMHVSGETLETHLARWTAVRDTLLNTYRGLTLDEFTRPRALPDYDVTPEWVLVHLAQHEAEHRAEIAALIKQNRETH